MTAPEIAASAYVDADWRNGQAYADLRKMDRSGLAWEWLRRTDDYRNGVCPVFAGVTPRDARVDVVTALGARDALIWGVHFR